MRKITALLFLALALGCASKKIATTADAQADLDKRYNEKIGKATKNEVVSEFGTAEWCQTVTEGEKCRFYLKKGTRWVGEKRDKKSVEQFDEVIADFDSHAILKSFRSNAVR